MHPLLILLIGVVVIIGLIIVLRVNAFVALIVAAMLVSLLSPGDWAEKIARVGTAFGKACGGIGIVIAAAAIIGRCLMDSGAADRIVRSFLRLLGEKRSSWALMGSGFVLSVPVFFDTVFYLLVPLARSMFRRTGKNYVLYVTAIVAGAGITHTLVPPTPGPLLMADSLGLDLGLMICVGLLIGLISASLGMVVCSLLDRFTDIPMRPYTGAPEPEPIPDDQLPPLWISLMPVVLPVLLISTATVAGAMKAPPWIMNVTAIVGHRDFALVLAAAVAMALLVYTRGISLPELAKTTETALMSGGVIILITAAGGAFGGMLGISGIKEWITKTVGEGQNVGMIMLLIAFLTAVVIKFAQGSGTVSMITTVGIFAGMGLTASTLGFNLVYLAMAIGSGSLVGDWMNNSGFWIFAKMSVLTEVETLKTWTILTAALGVIGLLTTIVMSKLLPLMPAA